MTTRDDDLKLLARILAKPNEPELSPAQAAMLRSMQADLLSGERHVLSRKQRAVCVEVDEQLRPIAAETVPRGRDVEVPAVLRRENLPMRPPHRRHEVT